MNRRMLSLGGAALGLLLVTGPALAHDPSGSTEEKTVTRACDAPADPQYSPPGPNDCQPDENGNTPTTYQATHYSNDVACNKEEGKAGTATPAGRLYMAGDPATQTGSIVVCNDGTSGERSPAQGRVIVSRDANSTRVTADGDKDNGRGTQSGWVTVQRTGTNPVPAVTCGQEYDDQGGRGDSDHPTADDKTEECVPNS